jgi:hypothetical protein
VPPAEPVKRTSTMRLLAVSACLVAAAMAAPAAVLVIGSDVPAGGALASRVADLLGAARVNVMTGSACSPSVPLCIAIGESATSQSVIGTTVMQGLLPESFALFDGASGNVARLLAVRGLPGAANRKGDQSVPIGVSYGAYAILERLGFAFVHPLRTVVPSAISSQPPSPAVTDVQQPFWPVRSWHYHTEHPLELTEFLQGFDANCNGVNGTWPTPNCSYVQSWESMVSDFQHYVDWLVANRQNRLEWIILYNDDWAAAGQSAERLGRLTSIISMLHGFGVLAVADVPVAERQQNAWYMTSAQGTFEQNSAEIATSVDRWATVGFDILATESGFSEFTHPACDVMLELLNFTAEYAWDTFSLPTFVKVHCSTGQTCPNYTDPRSGQPINFNYLPIFGTPRLSLMPHTVQLYSYDDPTAGSYGNDNFTAMFDFATWSSERATQEGQGREVVWHGESAYWVNYDIDVGLAFGPLYGERRLHDARYWAKMKAGAPSGPMTAFSGQNIFASGSEWSYWVGNTVAARAGWDPQWDVQDDGLAFQAALAPIAEALFFGTPSQNSSIQRFLNVMSQVVLEQRALFILGNGTQIPAPPASPDGLNLRNGIAYLVGQETWSTVEYLFTGHTTQPERVLLTEVSSTTKPDGTPGYDDVIGPLLTDLAQLTASHSASVGALRNLVRPEALALFNDLARAFNLTSLRASQVASTYLAVSPSSNNATRQLALIEAYDTTLKAMDIVRQAEAEYPVPWQRIASWRGTPTSYGFGFLWTVHSSFYMWRDVGLARAVVAATEDGTFDIRRLSPCYLNIQDPVAIGIGDDTLEAIAKWAHDVGEKTGSNWVEALADCLNEPDAEPVYPQDL